TDYTSFIAVDRTRVVAANGASKLIEQPALMPSGVNPETTLGPPSSGAPSSPSYSASSSPSSSRRSYGGGGWGGGGGGDVDPLTLLLALALAPLAWTLRRIRA